MTKNTYDWVNDYRELTIWAEEIYRIDDQLWFKPISEGKWSIAEIISHLISWDRFVVEERLNKIGVEEELLKPNAQDINDHAANYAKSGINKDELINEFIEGREKLVEHLLSLSNINLASPVEVGKTMINFQDYITGLTEHDLHHLKQIKGFLMKNGIDI